MNTTHTRKLFSILFIGFLVGGMISGYNLPPVDSSSSGVSASSFQGNFTVNSTPTPTGETESEKRYFLQFDEISFYYISSVASKVTGRNVEANLDVNNPIHPKMDQFEFQNYAVTSQVKPRISVFPIKEFEDLSGDSVTKQVNKLKQLITDQTANPPGDLPMLLGEPATQLMRAQLKYVNFQNGVGLRYIAEYGEQPWPFENDLLFYTFQGITEDGGYYISAVLPVNHADLEGDDGQLRKNEDYTKFQANYPEYIDYIEKQLNAEQANSFSPNLASLDAMIKSMVIEKKAPTAGKPTSQPTATVTNSPAGCTNEAAFVADITIPDDTSLHPGETFKKTWRLKNIGTCTWSAAYKLIFVSGDAMGASQTNNLTTANIPSNANLDVSISLKAPDAEGTYQGYYKIRSKDGAVFGIQPNGSNAFWVMISVVPPGEADTPTNTPASPPHVIPLKPVVTLIVPPKLIPVQP